MWELLSEFEIHFKIGHASFNVSLSPVSITSVLSTRYPSNFQCKSPAIILRFHSCRLDLNIFQDFAFSLFPDDVSYVISSMLFPSPYTDHSISRRARHFSAIRFC
jgi:hypothetical protein